MCLAGTCKYVRKKQLGRGWQKATKSWVTRRNQKWSSCLPSPSSEPRASRCSFWEPPSSRRRRRKRRRWLLLISKDARKSLLKDTGDAESPPGSKERLDKHQEQGAPLGTTEQTNQSGVWKSPVLQTVILPKLLGEMRCPCLTVVLSVHLPTAIAGALHWALGRPGSDPGQLVLHSHTKL